MKMHADTHNEFINKHPHGWISHLDAWYSVVEKTTSCVQERNLLTTETSNGAISGLMPLCHVRSPLSGNRLICMPYATIGGPLVNSPDDLGPLLQRSIDFHRKQKTNRIEIRGVPGSDILQSFHGFAAGSRYTMHTLHLDCDLAAIQKTFHRTAIRKNFTRSVECGLQLRVAGDDHAVCEFYHLYALTRKRLRMPPLPWRFFAAIWEHLGKQGLAEFLIAAREDRPIGGLMVFRYKERVSAEAIGWDAKHNSARPGIFLYWNAIQRAHEAGYKVFDFGRTSPDNKGLMEFKGRWGTLESDLCNYEYPGGQAGSTRRRNVSLLSKAVGIIMPHMPLPLFEMIGGFAFNHFC